MICWKLLKLRSQNQEFWWIVLEPHVHFDFQVSVEWISSWPKLYSSLQFFFFTFLYLLVCECMYVHGNESLVCKLSVYVWAWILCARVQCMCEGMSVMYPSWVYVYGMIATVHVQRPENNPQELIFYFHHLPLPGELSCQSLPFKPFK